MPFILRRLVFYLVAAWVALTINFFIPRLMPGNAVQSVMAKFPNLQPSAYKALEALLGVGHPGSLWHQYVSYLDNVFPQLRHRRVAVSGVGLLAAGPDPPVDHHPGRRGDGHRLPDRDRAGHRGRLAARRRARPRAARSDVPAGDPVLLLRADPGRAARHQGSCLPDRPGIRQRAHPGMARGLHQQRPLPLRAPGAHHHPHLDRGLDAADAQCHDHHERRGLRDRGPGQGPAQPPGHLHLRGPQRAAAPAARIRPGGRLRGLRRHSHGDRLLLPGHRAAAAQRGHLA